MDLDNLKIEFFKWTLNPFHNHVSHINSMVLTDVPSYLKEIFLLFPKCREKEEFENRFNPNDCSCVIKVLSNNFKCIRYPICQTTNAIRAKIGYNQGVHIWEIRWPPETRVIVISTEKALLRCFGYTNLIGSNKHSWGWN